jgi:hypothetical protein
MRHKRLILAIVVSAEVLVCTLFLGVFYQKFLVHQKVLGAASVAAIKKEDVVFPDHPIFKYYYELKPSQKEEDKPEWLVEKAVYTINADGLNDRYDYPIEKPADTFRIITIGDSFTFGHFVNTADNWTEKLEDLLNQSSNSCAIKKFEVINLGMRGFDIPYLIQRYENLGAKYNPDLIIWFENGSGFTRNNELLLPLIEKCEDEKKVTDPQENIYQIYEECWKAGEAQIEQEHSAEELSNIFQGYLSNFFQKIDTHKFIFFTFEPSVYKKSEAETLQSWMKNFPNISFSSVVPNIYKRHEVLPDSHPNKKGHETIAKSIYSVLHERIQQPCGK